MKNWIKLILVLKVGLGIWFIAERCIQDVSCMAMFLSNAYSSERFKATSVNAPSDAKEESFTNALASKSQLRVPSFLLHTFAHKSADGKVSAPTTQQKDKLFKRVTSAQCDSTESLAQSWLMEWKGKVLFFFFFFFYLTKRAWKSSKKAATANFVWKVEDTS